MTIKTLVLSTAACLTAMALPAVALAAPLKFQAIATKEVSMHANMTLITGEHEAILVDVPFARSDAYRVVADILDSGKKLTTIVVTHDHPDHFFGLDVLADAFPDARIVAAPAVARDMARSVPIKFARWSGMLGTNAPHRPMVPAAMTGDTLTIEGHTLSVIGPMQGDHIDSTVVWDPETRTLIAGDVVYNGMFVWLGEHTPARYDAWLAVLDRLDALHPVRVIAGHTRPGLPDDSMAIDWTRGYIKAFARSAKVAKTPAELQAMMRAQYPAAIDVYNCFLLCVPSQVATGAIPPWDE
ncbi:MBL fold metallo-hydrolase [Novosphingobium sp.]|uniref:MBL fold metallo-hydrolase n=1 Tax=Novosphingobium sp. TaxID=1874826 RepID=UPI003340F1FE